MKELGVAALGFLTAAIGAVLTYLFRTRTHSGTVETSDAATIFQAMKDYAEEQKQEVADLRGQVAEGRTEIMSLRAEITSLRAEITQLRAEGASLRAEADRLRTENAVTKTEAALLRRKVEEQTEALAVVRREIRIAKEPE